MAIKSGSPEDVLDGMLHTSESISWDANGTLICDAIDTQNAPKLVSDGAGGAIITWSDERDMGTNGKNIYAQKINSAGAIQWDANGTVISNTTDDQTGPQIVSDGAGGAIIAWEDDRGSFYDIYAQKINSAGIPQWDDNGTVICNGTWDQFYHQLVSDGAGGAIIVWVDDRGPNLDIYAQKFNSAGITQWDDNDVVICNATTHQQSFHIISDGSGGAIITWKDGRDDTGDIYAQKIDSAGMVQWTANGTIGCNATGEQMSPQVISDGTGGAIITWTDNRPGTTDWDIYSQRIDSTGATQWTANGTVICNATSYQMGSKIVSDGMGGAIITWFDNRNSVTTSVDIYAQKINSAGLIQWTTNGTVISNAASTQQSPQMVSDDAGGAIIIWEDSRTSATTSADIYAQRIRSDENVLWTVNGIVICNSVNPQAGYSMINDEVGGAIITWYDGRNSGATGYDIYAQKIVDPHSGGGGNPIPGFDLVIIGVISAISVVFVAKMHNKKKKLMHN